MQAHLFSFTFIFKPRKNDHFVSFTNALLITGAASEFYDLLGHVSHWYVSVFFLLYLHRHIWQACSAALGMQISLRNFGAERTVFWREASFGIYQPRTHARTHARAQSHMHIHMHAQRMHALRAQFAQHRDLRYTCSDTQTNWIIAFQTNTGVMVVMEATGWTCLASAWWKCAQSYVMRNLNKNRSNMCTYAFSFSGVASYSFFL